MQLASQPASAAVVNPGDILLAPRIRQAEEATSRWIRREVDIRAKEGLGCSSVEPRVQEQVAPAAGSGREGPEGASQRHRASLIPPVSATESVKRKLEAGPNLRDPAGQRPPGPGFRVWLTHAFFIKEKRLMIRRRSMHRKAGAAALVLLVGLAAEVRAGPTFYAYAEQQTGSDGFTGASIGMINGLSGSSAAQMGSPSGSEHVFLNGLSVPEPSSCSPLGIGLIVPIAFVLRLIRRRRFA